MTVENALGLFSLFMPDEEASKDLAKLLAVVLQKPAVITFSGEIGSGKTTIIRALIQNLGVEGVIKSPSFSLVETYYLENLLLHHFDLYRIHHEEELMYLGFRDYISDESICCIEWPENAGKYLPKEDVRFRLKALGKGRELVIEAKSDFGQNILSWIKEGYE